MRAKSILGLLGMALASVVVSVREYIEPKPKVAEVTPWMMPRKPAISGRKMNRAQRRARGRK